MGTEDGLFLTANNGLNWISYNEGFPYDSACYPYYTSVLSFTIHDSYLYAGTDRAGVWKRPLSEMTDIEELNENNSFSFYPNPASDKINISIPKKATIEILNINGQVIKTIKTNNNETTVDIENLSRGVYIIRALIGSKIVTKKLIKE